jgi:hypothetical protein
MGEHFEHNPFPPGPGGQPGTDGRRAGQTHHDAKLHAVLEAEPRAETSVYCLTNGGGKVASSVEHSDTVIRFHSSRMALSSVPTLKGTGSYVAQKCICCCA